MPRAYNFSPGPAALPAAVIHQAQQEFAEYRDWQTSVMEISHRSPQFLALLHRTQTLLRAVLAIPGDYATLLLPGGATGQTAAIPQNLATPQTPAAYLVTGYWSHRAEQEARRYCRTHIAATTAPHHAALPSPAAIHIPKNAAYLHIAENETVHGIEYPTPPPSPVPIAADLTSNIATRPLRIERYGLVYAGTQKTLGIAGLTLVIVRRDLIKPHPTTPSIWNYHLQDRQNSMHNTPPTYQIHLLHKMLQWIQQQGGTQAMEKANREKAQKLYTALDASPHYHPHTRDPASRSRINIPFHLKDPTKTAAFLAGAEKRGLIGLKGHKAIGGIRASLYNSMPLAGVTALIDYMQEFTQSPP